MASQPSDRFGNRRSDGPLPSIRDAESNRVDSPLYRLLQVAFWSSLVAVLAASQLGCASEQHLIHQARSAFYLGEPLEAEQILSDIAAAEGRNQDSAALELAMVKLVSGKLSEAENDLRHLRDRFDSRRPTNLARDSASLLADDTLRTFTPAGYEQVMIRVMLAVCSLAGDATDAEAYALQATEKQSELRIASEQRGVSVAAGPFQPIAIAPYLRGVLREATHHDFDDAQRAYQLVSAAMPSFGPAAADIQRATTGSHSSPGHGVLYVIACVGQGPILVQTDAPTTSTALSIASSVLNAQTNRQHPAAGSGNVHARGRVGGPVLPNIASVKVPRVVVPQSNIAAVTVRVGDQLYGATQTLTDVGQLATLQNQAEMPWTIVRAILRRATKELTVAKAGDSLGLDGAAGSLFHFAAASAWSGTEQADTRCWGLLPREIQVLRAELPVGSHAVQVQPLDSHGRRLGDGVVIQADMVDGRNTYAVVIVPNERIYHVKSPSG